jgi:putative restriction endonuclease
MEEDQMPAIPAILPEVPLTIRTAPADEGRARPYADEMDSEGRLRYRYRGTDPRHPDNVGLRRAMQRRLPLIYLFGVIPGQYIRSGRRTWSATSRRR